MSFKDKNILMVGRENYSFPFHFLVERWKGNNTMSMFWTSAMETRYEECDYNIPTYYRFIKIEGVKNYTLNEAADAFTENLDCPPIDEEYLAYLEENYTAFKNLNSQVISDQNFSGHHHFRTMCVPVTYEQQLYWLTLLYKAIEQMIEDCKPDMILDCDSAELPRTVLNEVAYRKKIPYITISYPRYEMYKIPSFHLSCVLDEYFVKEYEKCLLQDNAEEKKYIEAFKEKDSIKNPMHNGANIRTYVYKPDTLVELAKSIYCRVRYFFRQRKAQYHCDPKGKNPILFDSWDECIRFWIKTQLYRRKLMKSTGFFDLPDEKDKYVYLPLHLIPESTTFSMAPLYINELHEIELVSKALPAGWWLYVKEHQSMLGERGKEFYEKVKKIPNVKLVKYDYYSDPGPWIKKAQAVVTITGSAAYEAALLGVPAFVFADVSFSLMEGVYRIHNPEELPMLLKQLEGEETSKLNSAAAYIRAVKNVGTEIDLFYVLDSAYNQFVHGKPLEERFYKEIDNLQLFFEKAYDLYNEHPGYLRYMEYKI